MIQLPCHTLFTIRFILRIVEIMLKIRYFIWAQHTRQVADIIYTSRHVGSEVGSKAYEGNGVFLGRT